MMINLTPEKKMNKGLADGEWLCGKGDYLDYVQRACAVDPELKRADMFNDRSPLGSGTVRAVVHEFDTSNRILGREVCTDAADLKRHLRLPRIDEKAPLRRVCLLEGLSQPFIDVIGSHYKVDPSLFKDQERCVVTNPHHRWTSDCPVLPSVAMTRESFSLKYFEVQHFNEGLPTFEIRCAETGRHVGVSRLLGKMQPDGIVRRKCSFWVQEHQDGGWEVVILCDPAIREILASLDKGSTARMKRTTSPFQGGYRDFLPRHTVDDYPLQAPPRTSFLDDLSFYLSWYGELFKDQKDPSWVIVFIKKIIISHYHGLACYVRGRTSLMSWVLSRQQTKFEGGDLDWVEQHWSDVHSLVLRLTQYVGDLENAQLALGIPLIEPSPELNTDWTNCDTDFQYVHMHLKGTQALLDTLSNSMLGIASMAGNRMAQEQAGVARQDTKRSLQETQRAKIFTVVGLIFIPLAYTSGLFSMSQDYLPGGDLFYVYLAVSLPLVVAVVISAFLLDLGYGPDAKWSPWVFAERVKIAVGSWRRWREWMPLIGAAKVPPEAEAANTREGRWAVYDLQELPTSRIR